MAAVLQSAAPPAAPLPAGGGLGGIERYADRVLKPLARAIDRDGFYPEAFLAGLGQHHGYGAALGGAASAVELAHQLRVIEAVGRRCGATAFSVWCQAACAWYLKCAPNPAPRRRYLRAVLAGQQLAGTGMSNALKHLSGLETCRLRARAHAGGYVVDGALPWISNLGPGHLLLTAAAVGTGGYIMLAVRMDAAGIEMKPSPQFSGMMGVGTYSVRFRAVEIPSAGVLATPAQFDAYLARIKPGMILTQIGIGLGVMRGCLDIIEALPAGSQTDCFLDDGPGAVRADLAAMAAETQALARAAQTGEAVLLDVLRLRARASERVLSVAQATVLRCGACGYLTAHPAQRRLREALFVAIITPALKHLRRDIHALSTRPAAPPRPVQSAAVRGNGTEKVDRRQRCAVRYTSKALRDTLPENA